MLIGKNGPYTGEHRADKALELVFGELYQKYERPLQRFVFRVVKSEAQAKDVVQEVFVKLWEHRQEISQIRNIEDWLYKVTEHKMIDFLRKAAADGRLREALWNKAQVSVRETEEIVQARECHSIIYKAVDQLPPQRKLVYRLNREKGLNHEEIATALSISRHTVKNHLAMALRSIQRLLMFLILLAAAVLPL